MSTPMIMTVLAAVGGGAAFERLQIPAGAMIGAMVGVAALNLVGAHAAKAPGATGFAAMVAMGWAIGQTVTPQTMHQLWRATLPLLGVVTALMLFAGLLAVLLTRVGAMDGTTAFLASSPGGVTQMAALASSLGANGPLVAAFHTVRAVAVIVVSPVIARMVAAT